MVSTEELAAAGPVQTMYLDRSMVDGVVELPCGAHPTSNVPDYGIDMEHLQAYAKSVGEEAWSAYRRDYIDLDSHESYLEAVGGAERIAKIPPPVF